jgi:hypothetical protein
MAYIAIPRIRHWPLAGTSSAYVNEIVPAHKILMRVSGISLVPLVIRETQ